MYCGYITVLHDLRKHSNADRLQCVNVFGNNIIVDLSYKEGQKVVFFPVDGQLSQEYAEKNNLLRKKDADGNNIGGYLDPEKRNIKALRMRGEKSEGLVLPIETLSDYTDVDSLNVGDKITSLNGHLICEKYIPKKSDSACSGTSKKSHKVKVNNFPLFREHVDTEQLAYNQGAFKPGDRCTITLKLHGCFRSNTRVKLWDENRGVKIKDIKVGDKVIGYENGNLVPTKVLQVFQNGKTQEWREICISRNGYSGENIGKIICTPDHLFWNDKIKDYIPARCLNTSDEIYTVKQTPILSHELKEILLGLYLGDGHLCKRGAVAKIQHSQKKDHEEYLNYIIAITGGLFHKDKKDYLSGYGTQMKRILSKECISIKNFFDEILSDDQENKLSEKILPYFTDLAVAFLYMDDGSLQHNDSQQDRACFAICDYNNHDAKIICQGFLNLGYKHTLYSDPKGFNRIRLLTDDSQKLFRNIQKYIPPIMRYKLPQNFRDCSIDIMNYTFKMGYEFIKNKILSNKELILKRDAKKYDLKTETGNYVVGDVVVHNSSQRSANSLEIKEGKRKWYQKLIKKKPPIIKEWKMVSGTRRTILDSYNGGYYGSNAFRKPWHDFFKDKLEKGETVYYEIVGWVDKNTPIMPIGDNKKLQNKELRNLYGNRMVFSYGCDEGTNDVYVYRMTMTNEDGYVVEYPDWFMRLRCEQMGVKCVPLFEKFTFKTWEDLMQRVEKYYDGPDPIGQTHVKEGVVVRIENRQKFTAFKHKNFTFKVVEGLIKDTAEAPDMEEAQESAGDADGVSMSPV